MNALRGIYVVVDEDGRAPAIARAALAGGVRILQYRAKRGIVPETARALRELTREAGALAIMNDDAGAALAYEYDGVHLGPGDDGFDDLGAVRAALGTRIVGLSCGTEAEARAARAAGADYAGVGAVFATATKADAGAPIGLDGLARVVEAAGIPVAAIGGIGLGDLAAVRAAGAAMAAVVSAVAAAGDPRAAAEALVRAWNEAA